MFFYSQKSVKNYILSRSFFELEKMVRGILCGCRVYAVSPAFFPLRNARFAPLLLRNVFIFFPHRKSAGLALSPVTLGQSPPLSVYSIVLYWLLVRPYDGSESVE